MHICIYIHAWQLNACEIANSKCPNLFASVREFDLRKDW